tara:strand:- start:996 stop:1292 length:297 start_codon:yes stop_codon:yes gene_type:complete
MKLEYTTPELDDISDAIRQIKQTKATWLSRMKNELVVIVRGQFRTDPHLYNWVWVSSSLSDLAYLSNTNQTAEQIADIIVRGGWDFQPNLTITLEDLT